MKNKIKKWHIALMSFIALFVAVFASLFSLRADTVDEETGEVLTDNWEFDIIFYDSSVDNGKTPLTEINWDASDGGYGEGTPRVITVQINYKNNSAVTTYQPGELEISIPNLIYSTNYGTALNNKDIEKTILWKSTVIVGANDNTHENYDWNFISGDFPSYTQQYYKFSNDNIIEEKSNFEGSIQIQYTITPQAEETYNAGYGTILVETTDECIHKYDTTLQAKLSYSKIIDEETSEQVEIISNKIDFGYIRIYSHPWKKSEFTVTKRADKISSYDGLGSNSDEYLWVKYTFTVRNKSNGMNIWSTNSYPYLGLTSSYIEDTFPKDCIIYNANFQNVTSDTNIIQINSTSMSSFGYTGNYYSTYNLYVGYPKTSYNEEENNLNITNTVNYYGIYLREQENSFLDDDSVNVNLANFEFTYSGDLYGITKYKTGTTVRTYVYSDSLSGIDTQVGTGGELDFEMNITAKYTTSSMNLKFGDDLLYITAKDNSYRRLEDSEYYFSSITFPSSLKNGNSQTITNGKYNCELWLRLAGDNKYTLYEEFTNGNKSSWTFSQDEAIVGYYFYIYDLQESIISAHASNTVTINNATNIAEEGNVYNFNYLQVYFKDAEGNLTLQNQPTIDSYANFITREEIATFDQKTYSAYMQRAFAQFPYTKYKIKNPSFENAVSKSMPTVIQDAENEQFLGTANLNFITATYETYYTTYELNNYTHTIPLDQRIVGWDIYDLLPEGMILLSTEEDIKNSILNSDVLNYNSCIIIDQNGTKLHYNDLKNIIEDNIFITIENNWNNTNRTLISINIHLEDNPLLLFYTNYARSFFSASYNYSISYDSFIEFGSVWENRFYVDDYNRNFYSFNKATDNGQFDSEASDINNNNDTAEEFATAKASVTITSVISTHQDVTTYVKTDQSNYSTGIVDASCNSEYEYKLRVRTGSADVTNLVIYTSIEEAQPERTRWKGEFLDIDTTYAENKGYTVKVWYSENTTIGTLAEDTSWKEYDEATVDKSKVKSLAFQYLVETDDTTGTSTDAITPATLPANSLTYVLIKMKSPADESIKTLARMDCWTEWNAIDEFGSVVDGITGINSNVVKVALPNSVKTDDLPSISLKFTKEIQGETSDFENLKLNKADEQIFMIRLTSLTANDDGTYNQVTGLLSSTQGLVITQIPIGTYLLEELGDNYFDFVEFTDNNDPEIIIEGVTFEKTDQGYIITVSEDLTENIEFNIKVTNEIESKRFFEDKNNEENLFLINKTGIDHNTPED